MYSKNRSIKFFYVMPGCLCGFVLTQAVGAVYGETHEDDVSVWVGEGSQPVVVLLTGRVPESQLNLTQTIINMRTRLHVLRKGNKEKEEEGRSFSFRFNRKTLYPLEFDSII